MPNLEVLKLYNNAFEGPKWEPTSGEFCKLKFLLLQELDLVQWTADHTPFPSLERLILRQCFKLEEIPCSIGYITTLRIIDLDDASTCAVNWAKQIQEEQENWGNDSLKVHFFHQFWLFRLKRKEVEAKICGSNDDTQLLEAIALFSSMLIVDKISWTKELASRTVLRLFEFLDRDDNPQLQHQAALAITSISNYSSDAINILIDHGTTSIFVSLLSSPKDDLLQQALEVLGNFASDSAKSHDLVLSYGVLTPLSQFNDKTKLSIMRKATRTLSKLSSKATTSVRTGNFASDSAKSRDLVLSYGVLTPLLSQFNDKAKLSIMRKATRTLSKLCLQKPPPQFEQVKFALRPLAYLIHTGNKQVLICACSALLVLTNRVKDTIQVLIDAGVFTHLVELILYPSPLVLISALFIVRNIISEVDDIQIQVIIDKGALPCLFNLLTQNYTNRVKKVTCYIISSIIGRTKDHIEVLIEAGNISPLLKLLQNADHFVQEEACRVFLAISEGTNEQIKFLVNEGCIKPFCDLIVSPNQVIIITHSLLFLENIMKVGEAEKNQDNTEDMNVFAWMIKDAGGVQKIKDLQTHDDPKIRRIVKKLLATYWQEEDYNDEDDDEEDSDAKPNVPS
ncbi:importin subunit alpha-like [Olea europaea subsp. europaea]|uniref:Importin subunit alpha-like n=1 Tax=Olea europaea subsp. europaea TaxID=158383 RepID=A0A8S0V166_OLEEU|nr:importin subunit alpha-like [Olea europaea subsp. europaea]